MSRRPRVRNAAGELTEAAFQRRVIGLARAYDWRIYHAPDNRPAGKSGRAQRMADRTAVGFPDLLLIRPGRLVVAELKTRTGKIGPGQREWLDAFHALAVTVGTYVEETDDDLNMPAPPSIQACLWRPADWDTIHETLRDGQERREDLDPLPGELAPGEPLE